MLVAGAYLSVRMMDFFVVVVVAFPLFFDTFALIWMSHFKRIEASNSDKYKDINTNILILKDIIPVIIIHYNLDNGLLIIFPLCRAHRLSCLIISIVPFKFPRQRICSVHLKWLYKVEDLGYQVVFNPSHMYFVTRSLRCSRRSIITSILEFFLHHSWIIVDKQRWNVDRIRSRLIFHQWKHEHFIQSCIYFTLGVDLLYIRGRY